MQEIAPILGIAATACGLVIAGINIARGSKIYACKEEVNKGFKRVDEEIEDVRKELSEKASRKDVEKLQTTIERKFDKMETKIDNQTDDIKELIKGFAGMKAVMEQLKEMR